MLELDKVLVPTDFSEYAGKALTYAVALATVHRAEIVLLHVIPPPVYPIEAAMVSKTYSEIEQGIRSECDKNIRQLQAEDIAGAVPSTVMVVQGVPYVEIIRTARELDVDLIVIATHGYTGLKHAFLGSVAEKVVRKAPCPVLTVKDKEREFVRP